MDRLIYSMLTTLDGYTEDEHGFGWGAPEDLYGRRMYETMVYSETAHTLPNQPQFVLDWARQWQAVEKIVYSRLKADADHDISVDGPELAA